MPNQMGLTVRRLSSRAGQKSRRRSTTREAGEEIADQQIDAGDDEQQETDAGEHPAHQGRQQQGDEEPEAEKEVAELRGATLDQLGADNEVPHQEGRSDHKTGHPAEPGDEVQDGLNHQVDQEEADKPAGVVEKQAPTRF